MKIRALTLLSFLLILFSIACGSSGGSSSDDTPKSRIGNPIFENVTPLGLSIFSVGVENKFPFYDHQQTPEQIGVSSVLRTVRHIATAELYTFTEPPNHQQAKVYLKSLVDAGHLLTHEIHILNGPRMRSGEDSFINAFYGGQKTFDDKFVKDLPKNKDLQNYVKTLFVEVVAYARELESYGIQILICPELEDNHDGDSSYKILIGFLEELGWSRNAIVRNGGQLHSIPGIRYERHHGSARDTKAHLNGLQPGDVFNMDGVSFTFADEQEKDCLYTEQEVRDLINIAQNKGVIFLLWHSDLQGLYYSGCKYSAHPSLRDRNYVFKKPVRQASILLGVTFEEIILNELTQ